MVAAYVNTTSALVFHGSTGYFSWTMNLPNNNNNPATTDGGALAPITSGPLVSLPNGTLLYVTYDNASALVQYKVLVQDQSWIAIGYGTTMTNVYMCLWTADG